jgi:hypothetical protein
MGFISLNHHLDFIWLLQAHARTRHDGAAGVDGQTGTDYAAHLGSNLSALLERAKSGTYRAPAVLTPHSSRETKEASRRASATSDPVQIFLSRGRTVCTRVMFARYLLLVLRERQV